MKKTFNLTDLDCAAKMECAVAKLEGVKSAEVSFLTQKMTIEAEEADFDRIMKQAVKVCKKVEPDCRIEL